MKLSMAFLVGVLWTAGAPAGAPRVTPQLVLVEEGVSLMPVVVFADAPPMTRQAAGELADYIEKISGARPQVLEGQPDPLPERAVWVGYQPVLDELFPALDFDFQHPEEILIAANTNHLVIAGRDRWDAATLAANDGMQLEYGTANAVYTFLQDYLDVRWLWPGELGEDVIARDTLALEPFAFRYHPQIRSRGGIFNYSQFARRGYGRSHDWTRLQRVQLHSLRVPGGHAFGGWWGRFHVTNPEYFALQPDGSRGGGAQPYPGERTVKMCKSNPALWDEWMRNVELQLSEDPLQTVFDASANDSWASGYCICENCRAWDHPDGELRVFSWQGFNQDYVAMSDRQVHFANALGRKLKARYPDRDYYVRIMAYGHSRPPPVAAVPDDNVLVVSVANFLLRPDEADRASKHGALHRDQFVGWGQVARHLAWRPNKARRMTSKPHISPRQVARNFRLVAEANCVAVYFDMVWEHWATRGPMYYVMAHMAWNPYQDVEALLDDYYQRGFGPAAGDIRAYWDIMEAKWEQSQADDPDSPELFDDECFKQAYACLERAALAAGSQPEAKYARRVHFVRMGLDYTRMVTEARALMRSMEGAEDRNPEAAERVRRIWIDEIMPLATDEEYPYAINWGPTRPGHGHRMSGRYTKDLHRKW